MHTCTHAHTYGLSGRFPGVEGVRRGMCSLALLECSMCDEKRGAAAFPMQTPRHMQAMPLDRGHCPLTPPFLLGDSPGLLSVTVSSTPHPRGPRGVGTRCFKSHRSMRERGIFPLNQRLFPFCQFAIVYLSLLRYVPHLPLSFGSIVLIGVLCQSCIDCDH